MGTRRSRSTDVLGDAASVWAGLHGFVTLRAGVTRFPWPPETIMLDKIWSARGRVTDPTG